MAKRMIAWFGHLPSHSSFRPYVMAIGQAAVAWNGLQESLRSLFWTAMGGGWVGIYSTVWYAITNDSAQRDMLRAVARFAGDTAELSERAVSDIEWLLNEIRKVADARNDAIHAPLISWGQAGKEVVSADATHGHPRAKKLVDKHLLTEFRWCRDSAVLLSEYALNLDMAITHPGHPTIGRGWPWPQRPKLPNRGQKKERRSRLTASKKGKS